MIFARNKRVVFRFRKVGLSSNSGPPDRVTSRMFVPQCSEGNNLAADIDADSLDDLLCISSQER